MTAAIPTPIRSQTHHSIKIGIAYAGVSPLYGDVFEESEWGAKPNLYSVWSWVE